MKKLFAFFGIVIFIAQSFANLIITEVYFDGTDERIEVYNSGNDFSGSISLSGAKSSLLTIDDFFLSGFSTTLLGDNLSSILNPQYIFQSGLGLSISDTQAINISLYSGYELHDTFFVDQSEVEDINNQKTSFHKIGTNIFATTTDYIFNNQTGFLINPGKVFSGIIQNPEEPQPSDGGNFDLKITEVYFDGYGEWIELSNIGTGVFEDEMTLMINDKQINLGSIMIASGSSIVLGEEGKDYSYFLDQGIITNFYGSLSMLDTQSIQLKLLYQGKLLDTFYVDEMFVQQANSTSKQAFEKVWNEDDLFITFGDETRRDNVIDPYIANPGSIYTVTGTITNLDSFDYNTDFSYLTLPISCDSMDGNSPLRISEIFFGDGTIGSYIEVQGVEDFFGTVVFSGSLLSQPTALDIDIQNGQIMVITSTEQGLLSHHEKIINNSLELNSDGGWLSIFGQSGQVLDTIYSVSTKVSTSVYFDSIYQECARIFNLTGLYSPGFDQNFLGYFPEGTPVVQEKIVYVGGGGGGGGGSCPICPEVTNNCQQENTKTIAIHHIDYNPEEGQESVTLQSFLDEDIDFAKKKYYLKVKGQTSKKYIYETLQANKTQTFTKNFRFSNVNQTCVQLYHQQEVLDEYCYDPDQDTNPSPPENPTEEPGEEGPPSTEITTGSNVSTTGDNTSPPAGNDGTISSSRSSVIKIQNIIFNPPGKDAGNETITFKLITGAQVDLSDFRLAIRTRTRKIEGMLTDELEVKGTFGFPNSKKDGEEKICVSLVQDTDIYDTYCYDPIVDLAQPGEYEVSSIIDGDTFRIKLLGKTQSVRLLGVDAPESSSTRYGYPECGGKEAKTYLRDLIDDQIVRLEFDSTNTRVDSYGRRIAYVYLGDTFVNEQIIRDGHAREYTFKQVYDNVSVFKKAQQDAKSSHYGLRNAQACGGQRVKAGEEEILEADQEDKQQLDYTQYVIKIDHIVYDPPGSDLYNETVTLQFLEGQKKINLENFRLRVGENNRRIQGILSPGETKTIVGNFRIPNSRAECVSLVYEDHIFDTICYNPEEENSIESTGSIDSGNTLPEEPNPVEFIQGSIKILSLVPNPLGNDSGREKITLQADTHVGLTQGYYLKRGTKKTKFKDGVLLPGQQQTLLGTFGLTNKATCVTLEKDNHVFDKFCYPKADDGDKFVRSNGVIQTLSDIDLKILNDAKLVEVGEYICVSYKGTRFNCKKQSMSSKDKQEFKATQKRISALKSYLRSDWNVLYYNTDMKNYFALFDQQQELLDQGRETVVVDGQTLSAYDLDTWFDLAYKKPYTKKLTDRFQAKLQDIVVVKQYLKWRDEYFALLEKRSI